MLRICERLLTRNEIDVKTSREGDWIGAQIEILVAAKHVDLMSRGVILRITAGTTPC